MFIVTAILFLGVLIAIHEYGHFIAARLTGMKVLKYSIGFSKPLFHWESKKTGILYQIGMVPLGGYVQVKGMNPFEEGALEDEDSYQQKSVWKRAVVILAGPLSNLLVGWFLIFFALVGLGLPEYVDDAKVGEVTPGGPADKAGLKEGDIIVSVNGEAVETFYDVATAMHENPGNKMHLLVDREGIRSMVPVVPAKSEGGIGLIGIRQSTVTISMPVGKAAVFASRKCYGVVTDTLAALKGLVTRTADNVQVAGPPKIVGEAAKAIERGAAEGMAFMAFISLMLFLFNLLPIPALDGGRTVFLLYEVVSGRKVNKKFDAVLNTVFFFIMMGFIAIVSIKELFL